MKVKLVRGISEAGDIFISGGKKADETGRPCLPVTNRWKVFHKTEQRQTEETDKQTANANKEILHLHHKQMVFHRLANKGKDEQDTADH